MTFLKTFATTITYFYWKIPLRNKTMLGNLVDWLKLWQERFYNPGNPGNKVQSLFKGVQIHSPFLPIFILFPPCPLLL